MAPLLYPKYDIARSNLHASKSVWKASVAQDCKHPNVRKDQESHPGLAWTEKAYSIAEVSTAAQSVASEKSVGI